MSLTTRLAARWVLRSPPSVLLLPRDPDPDWLLEFVRRADPDAKRRKDRIILTYANLGPVFETDEEVAEAAGTGSEFPFTMVIRAAQPMSPLDLALAIAVKQRGAVLDGGDLIRADEMPIGATASAYLPRRPDADEVFGRLRRHFGSVESMAEFESWWNRSEPEEDDLWTQEVTKLLDDEVHELRDGVVVGRIPRIERIAFYDMRLSLVFVPEKSPFLPSLGSLTRMRRLICCHAEPVGDVVGEEEVLDVGRLVLDLAVTYDGVVVDDYGFRVDSPRDLLP